MDYRINTEWRKLKEKLLFLLSYIAQQSELHVGMRVPCVEGQPLGGQRLVSVLLVAVLITLFSKNVLLLVYTCIGNNEYVHMCTYHFIVKQGKKKYHIYHPESVYRIICNIGAPKK